MGEIARCSLGGQNDFYNEDLLYKLFGVNAELLIDHAWGIEPATISAIKAYKPQTNSICSGQVLHCPYSFEKAKLVIREMADLLALDLVDKGLVTDQLVLTVGYDMENLTDPQLRQAYKGQVAVDFYGREVPKHAHGTYNFPRPNSSTAMFLEAVNSLCDRILDPELTVRRINLTVNHVVPENQLPQAGFEQLDLFATAEDEEKRQKEDEKLDRERRRQKAVLRIKQKYGKNAILKGMNLEEGATAKDRNSQVGGHKA
jgi:DNA polymerase V